jgi:nitrate/nitrite-specific signal transduction histidine kinase
MQRHEAIKAAQRRASQVNREEGSMREQARKIGLAIAAEEREIEEHRERLAQEERRRDTANQARLEGGSDSVFPS